jgi:hypothetical protein
VLVTGPNVAPDLLPDHTADLVIGHTPGLSPSAPARSCRATPWLTALRPSSSACSVNRRIIDRNAISYLAGGLLGT